jgi:hypothetical protein
MLLADTSTIAAGTPADGAWKGGGVYMRTCPGLAPQYLGRRDPASRWYANSPAPDLFHPIALARRLR